MPFLTEDTIETDVALKAATDAIIAQAMTALDKNGNTFLQRIIRSKSGRTAMPLSGVPMGIMTILGPEPTFGGRTKDAIVISSEIFEIILTIIFAVSPGSDFQMIGEGIRVAIMTVLGPKLDDNARGFSRTDTAVWRFSSDNMFRAKLSKRVQYTDMKVDSLQDPLYTLPIQFKIEITRPGPYYSYV